MAAEPLDLTTADRDEVPRTLAEAPPPRLLGLWDQTGAPAMVLLRGMLGWRGSWLPTACNLVQNVGWATLEIWVIAEAATQLTDGNLRWVFTVAAGAVATLMALRPLGVVRGYLRRIAVWAVLASTVYLFVRVLGQD